MKRRFVSVFSNPDPKHNLLWRIPESKHRVELKNPVLLEGNLYKVKSEGKMDPKFFMLTKNTLYYTYAEQTSEIQGALDLRWLIVEFEEPINPKTFSGVIHSKLA